MSFDLAILHSNTRLSNEEAATIYNGLCDSRIDGVIPHPSVDDFYEELVARFPELDSIPDDRIDDMQYCPWSCELDRSPGHVLTACVWPMAETVLQTVLELADKHNLAVYDPQSERVHYPRNQR